MIKKILVPTVGSEHCPKAIQHACDLALKWVAMILLLHVIPPVFYREAFLPISQLDKLQEENGRRVLEKTEREVRKHGAKCVKSVIIQGSPANTILEFANTENVDMIIIEDQRRTGIKRFFTKNVSQRVFQEVSCNVRIVR